MPSVEERLAYLEGRVGDHTNAIGEIRTELRDLRNEMNAGFATQRTEFGALRGEMNQEFTSLRAEMDRRFGSVDAKFTWVIGIQVGMLLMVASAALGYFFK